jgi:Fe-S cluster biosynthesis and repair protein YggX
MALTCTRCGRTGEAPEARKVPFRRAAKEAVLAAICSDCWKEWEGMEVKVINEYRLNLVDAEHRRALERACFDFLGLPAA